MAGRLDTMEGKQWLITWPAKWSASNKVVRDICSTQLQPDIVNCACFVELGMINVDVLLRKNKN